jgi:hypothetical protein
LDLGNYTDFCALSVMYRELALDGVTGLPLRDSRGDATYFWQIRGIRRWPLRTPYTEVIQRLVMIATRPDINPVPRVVVDMSGVGTAVFEQVRSALSSYQQIETFGIAITGGEKWTATGPGTFNVSKVQLTSCLAEALGCERVVICPRADGSKMENQTILERELAAFKIRVSSTGYQSVEAMGSDHDDCVISISLPLWLGARRHIQMRERTDGFDQYLRPREVEAIKAEKVALELERIADEKRRQEHERELNLASWQSRRKFEIDELNRDPLEEKWWTQ